MPTWSSREGYLFKGIKLCIPHTSLREFLIWELHARGLARHFNRDKIIVLVQDMFNSVLMSYLLVKAKKQNIGLCTPLPNSHTPWCDLNMYQRLWFHFGSCG